MLDAFCHGPHFGPRVAAPWRIATHSTMPCPARLPYARPVHGQACQHARDHQAGHATAVSPGRRGAVWDGKMTPSEAPNQPAVPQWPQSRGCYCKQYAPARPPTVNLGDARLGTIAGDRVAPPQPFSLLSRRLGRPRPPLRAIRRHAPFRPPAFCFVCPAICLFASVD